MLRFAYHFGTKADLVQAIDDNHAAHIEALRVAKVAETGASTDLRDWVGCLVQPLTDHLALAGTPHLVRQVRRPSDDRSPLRDTNDPSRSRPIASNLHRRRA